MTHVCFWHLLSLHPRGVWFYLHLLFPHVCFRSSPLLRLFSPSFTCTNCSSQEGTFAGSARGFLMHHLPCFLQQMGAKGWALLLRKCWTVFSPAAWWQIISEEHSCHKKRACKTENANPTHVLNLTQCSKVWLLAEGIAVFPPTWGKKKIKILAAPGHRTALLLGILKISVTSGILALSYWAISSTSSEHQWDPTAKDPQECGRAATMNS